MERSDLDPAVVKLLDGYPIVVTTMVGWGDMDANHHVNNVVYFRYIEHARLHYFRELGFSRCSARQQHRADSGLGRLPVSPAVGISRHGIDRHEHSRRH